MLVYFGYGSNMNPGSLRAKGVDPLRSMPAKLPGWRLRFNLHPWYRNEGGMGNIERHPDGEVQGVVHILDEERQARMDAVELRGVAYSRCPVEVVTPEGQMAAMTYIARDEHIDDDCKPSRRYLNLLIEGAQHVGLDADYIEWLRQHPIHEAPSYPPFAHPPDAPWFELNDLDPRWTSFAGGVFDMTDAQPKHQALIGLMGGRDVTEFLTHRHDRATGEETLRDVLEGRVPPHIQEHVNAYLHEFAHEYRYIGRLRV